MTERAGLGVGAWRRRAEAVLISLVGGLLFFLGLRYPPLGPLLGPAYVVLCLPAVIERWRAPLLGFYPGYMAAGIWLHLPVAKFGWFVGVLFIPLLNWHYVITAVLARWMVRATRWPLWIVLPLVVPAGEALREFGIGDCNTYQVGPFLFHYPVLIQLADLIGAPGLSLVWTLPFAVGAEWLRSRIDGHRIDAAATRRSVLRGVAATVAALAVLIGYGAWRLRHPAYALGPRVAVIQPSLEHTPETTTEVVRLQVQQTAGSVEPGAADLIVWPENAILLPYDQHPEYQAAVAFVTRTRQAPLLFGTQGTGPDGKRPTCSALVVDQSGATTGRYDKVVLFPFTERRVMLWLDNVWPTAGRFIRDLTIKAWQSAPDGVPGPSATTLVIPWQDRSLRFWTPICYETNYPWLARQATRDGAEVFINLTSEGWLGWAVSNNQLAVSVLRAVESRVGMIRAGNTGPSCFVLPDGRIERFLTGERTGRMRLEPGALIHTVVRRDHGETLYVRIGDWLDRLPLVVVVIALLYGLVRRRRP